MGQLLDADGNVVVRVAVVSGSTGENGSPTDVSALSREATQGLVKTAVANLDAAIGAKNDAAATTDTGTFSVVSLIKRNLQRWTTLLERIPALVSGRIPVDGSGVTQPVSAVTRACVGRQTLALSAGAVTTLTVPSGAVAAAIQADGNTVRCTLDGGTAPSATVGTRIDDGVIYYVDTALANVKLLAPIACSAQIVYFDKA